MIFSNKDSVNHQIFLKLKQLDDDEICSLEIEI